MCAYSFVRTLVNALVLQGKTPPAQVAAGDDDHDCKWSIFASWWKEKHHQHKLRSVKTILGTSIGAGCSNQMQVAQGQDLYFKVVPLCKLVLVLVQLALVVFFLGALAHLLMCTQTNRHTLQLALCGGIFMWWL